MWWYDYRTHRRTFDSKHFMYQFQNSSTNELNVLRELKIRHCFHVQYELLVKIKPHTYHFQNEKVKVNYVGQIIEVIHLICVRSYALEGASIARLAWQLWK